MIQRYLLSLIFSVIGVCFFQYACFAQFGVGSVREPDELSICHISIPDYQPLWLRPSSVAKHFPTKENIELSSWCEKVQRYLLRKIQSEPEWNESLARTKCAFLINSRWCADDILVNSAADVKSKSCISKILAKANCFREIPDDLKNRRLCLSLNYPRIELLVDFHDPQKDKKYFEHPLNMSRAF